MTHGKTMFCLAGTLVFGVAASVAGADTGSNPYQAIVTRNVFGLKPPPPPPEPPPPQPVILKITLTGITDIFGKKQALMKTPGAPAKPGEQPKGEQSYILGEGEREGDIEVLEIDMVAGSVKVNNNGQIGTLTLEKDGPKIASAPAGGAPPGLPVPAGMPPGMVPGGGQAAPTPFSPPASPGNNPFQRSIPTRGLRLPGMSSPAPGAIAPPSASAAAPTVYPAVSGGYMPSPADQTAAAAKAGATPVSVPVGSLFGQPMQTPKQQNWPPEDHTLGIEEQTALLMLQRQAYANNPNAPPFPPLPGDPTSQTTTPTTGNQQTQPTVPQLPLPGGGRRPF